MAQSDRIEESSEFELPIDDLLNTSVNGVPASPILHDTEASLGPSHSNLRAGSRVGRYAIVKTLGQGGFGIVYLARDSVLERNVAIKISRTLESFDEKLRTSIVVEARSAASIDHPNIVRVFDVDQWENRTFMVMELVEGRSVADEIAKRQTLTLPKVLGILRQVASALEHLHAKGIIHRDLKPANILLTESDQVKVTDLGLALTDDSPLWRKRHIAGTQRYMSPEQMLGEVHRIDGRTDIWAFGIVAYELLTLQSPFRNSEPSALLTSILKSEIASPKQRRPDLPESFERICMKCLSRRMTDRFQSAKHLLDALDAITLAEKSNSETDTSPLGPKANDSNKASSLDQNQARDEAYSPNTEKKSSSTKEGSGLRGLVPRGLRSFTREDCAYYQRLMPGPYDLEGSPSILTQWKNWVEKPSREYESAVGVIYGPSGCGKSSFVQAALIPSLSSEMVVLYLGLPQNQWVKKLEMAPLQHVGFFALLKKQADMHERSQGLPKQPLACFLTPVALELVPTSALSSTEAT